MIKKQNVISQIPTKEVRYKITATLLNQWQRIFDAKENIYSNDEDTLSYEEKVEIETNKRIEEFVNLLNRIPTPDNEYMKRGREYEDFVCSGLDREFSPIIENGAFQITLTKKVEIDGLPILLYGVLDVLKAGRIYDIKRVVRYQSRKYKNSLQHPMYLFLAPSTYDFTYLVCDDKDNHYYENYIRENCQDILQVIAQFISWLKSRDLFEIFTQKWAIYA